MEIKTKRLTLRPVRIGDETTSLGASFSIRDGILTDPEGARRRLSPKTQTEFFIEGLPEILCFSGDNMVKLCGRQIIPQWSETGTIYTRENDMG